MQFILHIFHSKQSPNFISLAHLPHVLAINGTGSLKHLYRRTNILLLISVVSDNHCIAMILLPFTSYLAEHEPVSLGFLYFYLNQYVFFASAP